MPELWGGHLQTQDDPVGSFDVMTQLLTVVAVRNKGGLQLRSHINADDELSTMSAHNSRGASFDSGILLVDDQPEIRKLLRLTLQHIDGAEVHEADNVCEAWRLAQEL